MSPLEAKLAWALLMGGGLVLFAATVAIAVLGVINLSSATSVYVDAGRRAGLADVYMSQVYWLVLGTLLAINAIALNKTLLIPFFGFIFYVEIFSVILQILSRRLLGRRLFKMSPLHHHFEIIGWPEEKVVMRFWIIQAFMVVVGVWLALN